MTTSAYQAETSSIPVTLVSPPNKTTYRCRIITSTSEFLTLQDRWDEFLKKSAINNLCMSHAFLSRWLEQFNPLKLLVLIVEDQDGQWVGLAPFQINLGRKGLCHRILKHIQFIGTQPTVFDWMQLVFKPNANDTEIIRIMAQTLKAEKWDVLDLQFCKDHDQLQKLYKALNLPSIEPAIRESMPIPTLALPSSAEEYASTRRKKTRLEVNRHHNQILREFGNAPELQFHTLNPESEKLLDQFFAGHIEYWRGRNCNSDFNRYPQLRQFYKMLLNDAESQKEANKPYFLFSTLTFNGQHVSFHFGFWQGNGYLSHITNYKNEFKQFSPGTIHMDTLVFETIKRQGIEFEFGRGDEPYKKMWTQEKKSLWELRLFRKPLAKKLYQVDLLLKKLLRKEG